MSFVLLQLKKGKYFVISLFLIVIILPFNDLIIEPTNTPRFILISVVLFLFILIETIKKKKLTLPPPYLSCLFLGFYLINLISGFWSLNVANSLYESQKILIGFLTIISILTLIKTEKDELILIKSLILISIICASYALYETALILNQGSSDLYQIHSFFGHKNLFSSFLFLSLTFPIYGYSSFTKRWKIISAISFIILLTLIFLLQNRTTYLATLISLSLVLIFYFKKLLTKKTQIFTVLLLCSISFLVVIKSNLINAPKFDLSSNSSVESINERTKIWNKTFQLIMDNPLLGVGSGNWQYNFSKYSVSDIENITHNNVSFQKPHNDFLWILSETGILGFSFILLIILFLIKKSIPKILLDKNEKIVILFSFLTGLLIISFFSFPKERVTHILLTSIIIGLLIKNLNLTSHYINTKKFMVPLFLISLLFFNIIMGTYRLKGEYFTNLMLSAKKRNNPKDVINYGKKAISFFYNTDPTSTPVYSYIGWGYNTLNNMDSLLFYSTKAYELSPYNYEVLTNYGYALERNRQPTHAKTILLESHRINPFFETTLVNLVVLEYNNKNYSEALKWLKLIPNYENKHLSFLIKINEKLSK